MIYFIMAFGLWLSPSLMRHTTDHGIGTDITTLPYLRSSTVLLFFPSLPHARRVPLLLLSIGTFDRSSCDSTPVVIIIMYRSTAVILNRNLFTLLMFSRYSVTYLHVWYLINHVTWNVIFQRKNYNIWIPIFIFWY